MFPKQISSYWRGVGNSLTTKTCTDTSQKKNKHFTENKHVSVCDSGTFNAVSRVAPESRSHILSGRFLTFQENSGLGNS